MSYGVACGSRENEQRGKAPGSRVLEKLLTRIPKGYRCPLKR
jgi:hypothetical protein